MTTFIETSTSEKPGFVVGRIRRIDSNTLPPTDAVIYITQKAVGDEKVEAVEKKLRDELDKKKAAYEAEDKAATKPKGK